MTETRRESILESQVVLLAAHALSLGLGLVVTILLARRLNEAAFAGFIVVSGALALAAQLVDAGLQPAVVAELAGGRRGVRFMRQVILQRFGLAMLAVAIAFAARSLLPATLPHWLLALAILMLPLRTFGALFAAGRRNRFQAWGNLFVRAGFCAAVIVLTAGRDVLAAVLVAYLLREIAMSLYPCLALIWSPVTAPKRGDAARAPRALLLLAGATMFSAAYFHVDVFMLRALALDRAVADYGLAVRVLGPLVVAASLVFAPFLPFLSAGLREGEGPPPLEVGLTAIAALGAMLPVSMVLLIAPPIIRLMTGADSLPASEALATLAWSLPAIVVGISFSTALIMAKRYGAWAAATFVGLALNIILNRMWIPEFGALGAAWATVATEVLVAFLAVLLLNRCAARRSRFTAAEVFGAGMAACAPSALALGLYLVLLPETWNGRLVAGSVLAILAATVHMFFGVARTLRRHFESLIPSAEERS